MKSILLCLPVLLLMVTNFVFGVFWVSGFYYCRYVLAILGTLYISYLIGDKLVCFIKKVYEKKKEREKAEEAEELKYEYQLLLVSNAAKAETEKYLAKEARKEEEKNEEFMLLVARGVEIGLEKALKKKK